MAEPTKESLQKLKNQFYEKIETDGTDADSSSF